MKLFGGKKSEEKQSAQQPSEADDFDSPQENISFNQASAAQASQRPAAAPHVEEDVRPAYGIEQAIALMRTLPNTEQSVELVVTVIKATLESLKVKVTDIIDDASRKQKDLEGRVANLKQAIADFEKEIATRKEEIARLETDHTETTMVKGRLELAEKMGKPQGAPSQSKPPSAVMGVINKPTQPQGGKA
jgi:chromosome segregation ATPase